MPLNNVKKIFFLFIILSFFYNGYATLSKSDRKSRKNEKSSKKEHSHEAETSLKSNLIKRSVQYQEVLKEHKSFSITQAIHKHFPYNTLGYVTPWNNHGYDIVKLFTMKFNMISPVWLQLKPKEAKQSFHIQGLHDIDRNWLEELKQLNKEVKIVPRLIFEQWTYKPLVQLLEKRASDVSLQLTHIAKEYKFHGYVLEIWSLLGGQLKRELTEFIINLSSGLRDHSLFLILVIPPPSYSSSDVGIFVREDFENLADHVAAFSLMSYDFSNSRRPGPNSPLPWLLQCVEDLVPDDHNPNRKKLLLGLNFYGYDYSAKDARAIIGHEYISLLEKYKPKLDFNNITGEHSFIYRDGGTEHIVFFPTLYSIQIRLQLASQLNVGIAVWETGQGLDYFYDLL